MRGCLPVAVAEKLEQELHESVPPTPHTFEISSVWQNRGIMQEEEEDQSLRGGYNLERHLIVPSTYGMDIWIGQPSTAGPILL